jgi:hypothetical protein
MHQTKKSNQWCFGMKAHFGVDSRTKLIHAVAATPVNVADSTVVPELLHGNETRVWGDQAYRGQRAVIRRKAPRAHDFVNRRYRHRGVVNPVEEAKNRTKSTVRAKSLPSRKRGASTRSGSSSGCSALPRCATAGSTKTGTACSSPRRWPISTPPAATCCAAQRRNAPAPGDPPLVRPQDAIRQPNHHPILSVITAIPCFPAARSPLIQIFLRGGFLCFNHAYRVNTQTCQI